MSSYNAALIPQEHSSQAPHIGPVQHQQPDHTNHPRQVQHGRQPATTQHGLSGMNDLLPGNRLHMTDRYTTHTPAMLQGIQCYADASTPPDQASMTNKLAGIGVFIVNTQVQPTQTVYIKAKLTNSSSVIMAEAAALALAAAVANSMDLNNINFLSDCEQLVHFLNAADQSNPPDWRIKYFTQLFANHSRCRRSKIFKIPRCLNTTADTLARQVLSDLASHSINLEPSCTYTNHASHCSLVQALQSVSLNSVSLLSAVCC